MTKNYTTVEFHIETLENRDAPTTAGSIISGGAGSGSLMTNWAEYKQANDLGSFGQILQGTRC